MTPELMWMWYSEWRMGMKRRMMSSMMRGTSGWKDRSVKVRVWREENNLNFK